MHQILLWSLWVQQHFVAVVTAIFVLIWLSTYWPGRRDSLEQHGRIPLDDDF